VSVSVSVSGYVCTYIGIRTHLCAEEEIIKADAVNEDPERDRAGGRKF